MINVHVAANAAIQAVNSDGTYAFYASAGFTVGANGKQIPSYSGPTNVPMQIQATSASDLKKLADLNVEGVYRSVHMFGNTQGVVRVNQKGGDLLYFPEVPAGTLRIWKVVKVMETWSDWCRIIVCLQTDQAPPP